MMELKNITKRYRGKTVVDNVSLVLPEKRVVSVIGPNGAGKSTLLHIMTRLAEPDSGEAFLDGKPLREWKGGELARRVSILAQSSSLQGRITVRDLVALGRFPCSRGRMTPKDWELVERSLAVMDLESCAGSFLDQLSGGQRQRALIGMVLAQDTEIVLLDEPLTSLDVCHAAQLMKTVRRLCSEMGKTVAMVLHEINSASFYSDFIFAMKDGKLLGAGTPEEIISPAFLRSVYDADFTAMQMNGRPFAVYY